MFSAFVDSDVNRYLIKFLGTGFNKSHNDDYKSTYAMSVYHSLTVFYDTNVNCTTCQKHNQISLLSRFIKHVNFYLLSFDLIIG